MLMGRAARRVFIGIPAGKELREQVLEFRKRHDWLRVGWIRPENLHLTVIPPWLIENPESVCTALGDAAHHFSAADVEFTTVSTGPDAAKPRLIWATGKTTPFFSILRDALYARIPLERTDERSFLLHLTIARVMPDEQDAIARMKLRVPVVWSPCLRTISLYESILNPNGAEYRVLYEVPFAMNKQQ
ncbi:MAG: RNA 2',3'-cyclic phosphodiesterase [Chlorobium limicola]|nr:RNA 2',3'-cyclic phosphodiesterase [Chlorobium limicola]